MRLRHEVPVTSVRFDGAGMARPAPGVIEAIEGAEAVIICPSNPIISIGPILAVPGIADALRSRRASVVAISPIVAGAAFKGPADHLMAELGHEPSVVGVARIYCRFRLDPSDRRRRRRPAADVESAGMRCVVTATVMSDTASPSSSPPGRSEPQTRVPPEADSGSYPSNATLTRDRRASSCGSLLVLPVHGIGEVDQSTDLASMIADAATLEDGDVVVVTQKIVSKAEGRIIEIDPDDLDAKRAIVEVSP